jgi:hypothetical protein
MRFCHPFTQKAGSSNGEQALVRYKRVDPESSVQREQPRFIVFSRLTVFPGHIARPTPSRKNLTEIPFAHNFAKPDLEVL